MQRLMKLLHELGSYGLVGGFAVQLLALYRLTDTGARQTLIADTTLWITAPSLALVLISGLLVMIVRPVFFSKGWVWLKIFLTVPTVYVVIATFPGLMTSPVERTAAPLGLTIGVSIVITWLSVWRPKGLMGLK